MGCRCREGDEALELHTQDEGCNGEEAKAMTLERIMAARRNSETPA